VKHALFLPPFGELADPRVVRDLAVAAEEQGWDGLFLWDHVLRPPDEVREIADVWVTLAAVASATTSLRIGPMVTPLVRRRVQKVAREVVTLDLLSSGRLTVGLGLGVDTGGELSKFGELTDERTRGDLLDEGAHLLDALMSGEEVSHRGTHFTVDGVRFLPRPLQQPRVPLWFATRGAAIRPVRRAARYDGIFPIEIDGEGLSRVIDLVVAERGSLEDFDVAVAVGSGADVDDLERRGATWAMWDFGPGEPAARIAARITGGP
jgi:alkanesulfonate monooxygenase SsuD/methylene tetrahydromethanopterin reductase-like flavin-dependent oxidoreductase (luciferase family)